MEADREDSRTAHVPNGDMECCRNRAAPKKAGGQAPEYPGLLPALGDDPREGRYGVSGCAFGSIFTIQRPLYMSFT